jgi:tetratricopeptide (TPR) repeat protein
MVNSQERWLRVLRPLALLALFVLVMRGLPAGTRPEPAASNCEPADLDGADLSSLARCLEVHPDDVELMIDLGRAHEAARQWDRAEALYRQALEVDRDDGDAHLRLGEALLRRGDVAGALREGSAALAIQPGNAAVRGLIERSQASASGTAR